MSRQAATKAVRRENLTRFEARFRQYQAKRRAAMLAEAAQAYRHDLGQIAAVPSPSRVMITAMTTNPTTAAKNRERERARYKIKRDEILAQKKARHDADPAASRERHRAYAEANREKVRAWDRARSERDHEKRKAQARARYAANIEKMREVARARYWAAKEAGIGGRT